MKTYNSEYCDSMRAKVIAPYKRQKSLCVSVVANVPEDLAQVTLRRRSHHLVIILLLSALCQLCFFVIYQRMHMNMKKTGVTEGFVNLAGIFELV